MQRRTVRIAVPVCAAALGMAPVVARADVVPAPPASATAVAAQVGSLLDVSKTDATAGSGGPTAGASVIRLQGEPVLNLGGTQQGDGESGGSLLDTGASLPVRAQVAPWHAAASGAHSSTRHAKSAAAVARADVPDVARAGVLTSSSEATYTDQRSTGTAVSDGADLAVLDALDLDLLHSEVNSDGRGHSYLVGVNGTEIGTDDQLGASPLCSLSAPGLLNLSCLTASGGNAAPGGLTNGAANLATVSPVLDVLAAVSPVSAFTAASSSGSGTSTPVAAAAPAAGVSGDEASRSLASPAPAASAVEGQQTGRLPRTGTNPAALLATALSALLAGLGLRRFRTRPAAR